MIITKARDNHLIKLTRELALYLMNTPRNGSKRGLIVLVTSFTCVIISVSVELSAMLIPSFEHQNGLMPQASRGTIPNFLCPLQNDDLPATPPFHPFQKRWSEIAQKTKEDMVSFAIGLVTCAVATPNCLIL